MSISKFYPTLKQSVVDYPGKGAEVRPLKEKGLLYTSVNGSIILCTQDQSIDEHQQNYFTGVLLKNGRSVRSVGTVSVTWTSDVFEIYQGVFEIQQAIY